MWIHNIIYIWRLYQYTCLCFRLLSLLFFLWSRSLLQHWNAWAVFGKNPKRRTPIPTPMLIVSPIIRKFYEVVAGSNLSPSGESKKASCKLCAALCQVLFVRCRWLVSVSMFFITGGSIFPRENIVKNNWRKYRRKTMQKVKHQNCCNQMKIKLQQFLTQNK